MYATTSLPLTMQGASGFPARDADPAISELSQDLAMTVSPDVVVSVTDRGTAGPGEAPDVTLSRFGKRIGIIADTGSRPARTRRSCRVDVLYRFRHSDIGLYGSDICSLLAREHPDFFGVASARRGAVTPVVPIVADADNVLQSSTSPDGIVFAVEHWSAISAAA